MVDPALIKSDKSNDPSQLIKGCHDRIGLEYSTREVDKILGRGVKIWYD